VFQAVEVLQLEYVNGKTPDARVMPQKVEVRVEVATDTKLQVRVLVEELRQLLVIPFRKALVKLHPAALRAGWPQLGSRDRRIHMSQEWKVKHAILSNYAKAKGH
jgi:hypothetical protein